MIQVRQSFAAGELAPELHMRSDLTAYQKGAALVKNMVTRRTGSAMKRPGTDALDITDGFGEGKHVRMFPFYYDSSLSFALLITFDVIRVIQVSPLFVADRDFEWELWDDDDVAAMRVRQVGDTLFCTTPGKTPIRMIRTAATGAWTVSAEQVDNPPSYTVDASACTIYRAGWTDYAYNEDKDKYVYYAVYTQNEAGQRTKLFENKSITIRKIWEAGASLRFYFTKESIPAGAVGNTWILCKKYGGAYGEISSHEITSEDRTGTGSVMLFEDDYIIPDTFIGKQTDIRAEDDAGGYAITDVYQQRQVLSGNANAPWSLWFSRLADLYTWTANRPTDDMDPFRATIPAIRASDIRHILSGQRLLLLTTDGIYAVHSGTDGFSARTCRIEKVNPTGVGEAVPLDTGSAVLFIADDDRMLQEMRYSFAENAHVSVDRSVLSRHLTNAARITRMAWQPYPDGLLWMLLSDHTLLSFTYLPEHEVYAWTRHELVSLADDSSRELVDIVSTGAVLRSSETAMESTSTVVILTKSIAPTPVFGLLRMRQSGIDQASCVDFLRSRTLDADETVEFPMLPGAVWRINGGAWSVNDETSVTFGPYESSTLIEWATPVAAALETLRPESPEQALQGKRKNIVSCMIRTLQTGRFTVSDVSADPADANMKTACTGSASAAIAHDTKIPPITGWDWEGRLRIESLTPDPLHVLGIVTELEAEDPR